MDIDDGTAAEIAKNYDTICDIVTLSALNGEGCEALEKYLRGKTACFAGQSAVGKTSILNALLPGLAKKTGSISQKSGRGTHTTRHTSLHEAFGGLIADTCGFSLCAADVDAASLRLYLDDFMRYASSCRFSFLYAHRRAGLRRKAGCAEGRYLQGKVREVRRGVQRTFTGGKTQILR